MKPVKNGTGTLRAASEVVLKTLNIFNSISSFLLMPYTLKISIKDAKHSVSKRRDACVSYPSQARDGPITNVSRSLSLYVKPISGLKGSSLPPLRDTTIDGPSP